MTIKFSFGWKTVVIVLVALIVLLASAVAGTEYYTSQVSFCGGTCHVMQEQYDSWKISKHNPENNAEHKEAKCVDCHYAPGEKFTLKAKYRGLGLVFSYLTDPDAPVKTRPLVKDQACLRSGCHAKEKFQDKVIKFTEKVVFKHKIHFEKNIEGQKMFCDTCHIKYSREKHFEVPKEMCFLCHFRNTKFNEGRNKCSLCHTIPTKSLQRQKTADDLSKKPITHQTIQEAKVPCQSCHYQLFRGDGEIKNEDCRDCHNQKKFLAEVEKKERNKKLLHEKHVATQQALCFDCHRPIQHKDQADFQDYVRVNCVLCHPDQHRFQKILLAGAARDGVSETPGLMAAVKTNCIGCHTSEEHEKGQTVFKATGKACVGCHTEKEGQMVEDWKQIMSKELKYTKELEDEALRAIDAAHGKVSEERLKEAMEFLGKGRENLHIVEYGNGVHNKKYAIMLLDTAMTRFEDLIDSLAEGG